MRPKDEDKRCLRAGCRNQVHKFIDVCDECAIEAKNCGCSWGDLRDKKTGVSSLKPSELRKGYVQIQKWMDEGMHPAADIAFTEGDCRLAAQLVEYAKQEK